TPARFQTGSEAPPVSHTDTRDSSGGFSLALYLKHREYNAAIGAVLLYLSLLFLRPVLEGLLHSVR
ncbi:MAG: hypothetical protein WBC92_19425, partial [Terracidiphilus sp.]